MTNITLSIEDTIYELMRRYSEIRWSEFVRKAIKNRIEELQKLDKHPKNESIMTMFASEDVLKKDWDNEADERWNDV
jgi:hypothetical protein